MKKTFKLVVATVLLLASFATSAFAQENVSKSELTLQSKQYIEQNKIGLKGLLSELNASLNLASEDIVSSIENYYSKNPAPKSIVESNLSLSDVYSVKRNNSSDNFNITDFMNTARSSSNYYKIKHDTGYTEAFVSDTGDLLLLNHEVLNSTTNSVASTYAAAWQQTRDIKETASAYNSLGFKMYDLWVSGAFLYNSSDVKPVNNDGGFSRAFWGSTINVEDKGMGKTRDTYTQGIKYSEIYSRLYTESVFGIKWAGLTLDSNTVEIYIGGSKEGGIYGSIRSF